ncbi:MAG: inorganic phosphate transporter [Candidatus Krumholzibacteria bacterium]|nr:inorganic phosphate transporter [Candidatus Krumholzibacteria bacterium]MDH4338467.1 inorganic phosphate transporter [Candidatus Krumholzibacteria bacterium]MDH5271047.1 inorganic phosphate transporter [Candidatus Krumholzibacteria bacterium]
MLEIVALTVILAILFDISNGWNDSANAIATVVSTRVLSPRWAVTMAACMNILGAMASTAVAKTIGKGVVDPSGITEGVVVSALIAGFVWNGAMTLIGLPVSASHALIGSLMGAAAAHAGWGVLNASGLQKIFAALLISPVIGLAMGFLLMKLILRFFGHTSPGTLNKRFGRLQLLSSAFMAFGHGSNDAQKVMGIITLSLFSGGYIATIDVPRWVVLVCAIAMGLGTAMGGWKVIRTIGVRMLRLEPVHGFAAETAATAVILGASHVGLPVSTTHVITSTIMGVGATRRLSAVRWGVAGKIVAAWVFTLPACIVFAWIIERFIFSKVL